MEVLVVGNTAYVDDDFCAKAFPGDHVKVVAPCLVERAPPAPGSGLRVRPRGLPV